MKNKNDDYLRLKLTDMHLIKLLLNNAYLKSIFEFFSSQL